MGERRLAGDEAGGALRPVGDGGGEIGREDGERLHQDGGGWRAENTSGTATGSASEL